MNQKATVILAATALTILCGCHRAEQAPTPPQTEAAPPPTKWNASDTRVSPFTRVRFDDATNAIVTYDGAEYRLAAINGVTSADLSAFCQKEYHDSWQKRFAEDLIVALNDMGHPPTDGGKIDLILINLQTGATNPVTGAPMTTANRDAVHKAYSPDNPD